MKTAITNQKLKVLLLLLGIFLSAGNIFAQENIVPADMREIAVQQGIQARKLGAEADLSPFVNASLFSQPIVLQSEKLKGITGSIRAVVGGRNFSAADVDSAEIPFSTSNGYGLTNLFHDGGEWPGTNGNPDTDDGRSSFGSNWAGEIYDIDGNGHYPKAVLRYIGSHCYIFVPVMYFPTLPRGISTNEEVTPAAEASWGLYWPDSTVFSNGPYYYAPDANGTVLEPRYVLGSDKNLARLKLKELADQFDGVIYPKIREYFGSEADVDGDPKIYIMLDDIRDGSGSFRGYFWAGNQFPRTSQSLSNEKELLNIDMFPSFALYPTDTYGTVAHEFTHMVIFNEGYSVIDGALVGMERWLEEGLTQYGQYLYNGKFTSNLDEFLKRPDTILVENRISEVWLGQSPFANYGASILWVFYLVEKYGGANVSNFIRNIIRHADHGMGAIDSVLTPFGTTAADVFADWTIANYLDKTRKRDGSLLNDGKWGYNVDNDYDTTNNIGKNETLPVKFSEKVILSDQATARSSNVNPWAADYVEISGNTGNLNLGFDGDDRTQFRAAVIKRGPDVDTTVEFLYLNDKQSGNLVIQNYGAGGTYENLVLVPMVTGNANYEKMNYVYSGTFDDLKVALFPNPAFENFLHIVVGTESKFAAEPRLQMTFEGEQGYLTMVPVNDSTYISNYNLNKSGEGSIVANGTNENGVILSNSLQFSAVYYPPGSEGLLKASFATVDIPRGSLKTGGTVTIAASENTASYRGIERVSRNFDVGLPVEKAASPIKIEMPVNNTVKGREGKAGLYRVSGEKPVWLGPLHWKEATAVGSIENSCSVFVGVDESAPTIENQSERLGNGWVAVKISDIGSGIKAQTVKAEYDGISLPVKFDAESGKVLINTAGLLDGNYEFDVQAEDNASNFARASIKAQVAGPVALTQMTVYPNPARVSTTIRASFNGTVAGTGVAAAKIMDVSGHKVAEIPMPYKGSGIYEARWDLRNSGGEKVANAVYYAEIKVQLDGKTYKQRQKIAVLR